ncbi:MAG: glycosyltransferase [Pyrinomonadaceae bacterium]
MKEKLKRVLPLSLKISLRRLTVGLVGSGVRTVARVVRFGHRVIGIAVNHGLDLQSAWDVKARPDSYALPPFSSQDFLFIMDALKGVKAGRQLSGGRVRCSIVIPVFNKVEYTFQCLRSLIQEIDLSEHEIIVVNNASSDETARVLACFKDIVRVINNEANMGFVDACNQGAAVARGEYLVFLNNDTVVLEGWLKNLLDTIEDDSTVGAVGSLFLYPDGLIQEAGAIVWKDGGAFHYGWGKSTENRKYVFAREVDYCSGASLLIRKTIFDSLGGFDRRFAPAYYEDIDLCMGVRSLGYKVVYQPASRIIHYEGVTAGRDTQAGFKHFQIVNREKLVEKWRDVLEREHCENDPALAEKAANRKRGPNILVIDDHIPTPDRDAGSARMLIILRSLAKIGRPVFLYLRNPIWPEYEKYLWKEGIETASIVDYPRLLKERNFRAAILSRPDVAGATLHAIRRRDKKIKIVFDMVDAYFLRLGREYALTGDAKTAEAAARYKKLELELARSSDLVWCNSSEDKRVLNEEVPTVPIEVIPTIHQLHDRGKTFAERRDILFLGNLIHPPNSDGVRYLVEEIFPLIQKSIEGVKLYIVGDNVTPEIAAYTSEAVRVLGYVPDIGPLFQSCRVFVAPLRFGAGVKGKIGEALAYGLPVVTTSIGAESMGFTNGEEALIADTPPELADAVTKAYLQKDLWQRLSDHGYAHIEKHFTPQVIGEIIRKAVTS